MMRTDSLIGLARRAGDWAREQKTAWRTEGVHWRQLAYWGARHGPRPWVRYSPPWFGIAFGLALPQLRERVRGNLRRVVGKRGWFAEQLDVGLTLSNYAHCLAESLAGARPEARTAKRRVLGVEHLLKALGAGRGLVVVTAHMGAWDVAARLLEADWGVSVLLVMQREADSRALALHDGLRVQDGLRVAHIEHPLDGLGLWRHLRAGGAVAVQLDRLPVGVRSIQGVLFGEPFGVPEGPFKLAAATGAPVLPVFARRMGFFEYEVQVNEPQFLPRGADRVSIQSAAQQVLAGFETVLRRYPTQWFHFESDRRSARSL